MLSLDRARGALLGLATGDALGTTNEFSTNPPPLSDIVGGGPFQLLPGQWTDDTSMALCLADSLIERQTFDPADQMRRYLAWWREGHNSVLGHCFDIGNATRDALARFSRTGDPYAGSTDPYSAGNGSLMRLSPVVVYFALAPEDIALQAAEDSSRVTHAAPQALACCRAFTIHLRRALYGLPKQEVLAGFEPQPLIPSGYVVDSMNVALSCFEATNNFRDGALMAANLGGDADTNAAIYGQLAGAFYGESGIPATWLSNLAWVEEIRAKADALHTQAITRHSVRGQ